jgi:hypothetical protein
MFGSTQTGSGPRGGAPYTDRAVGARRWFRRPHAKDQEIRRDGLVEEARKADCVGQTDRGSGGN